MFHIETDRLVIKPHQPVNAIRYHQWLTDPDLIMVLRDNSDSYHPPSMEEVQTFMNQASREPISETTIYFAIHTRMDDDFIGYGMLMEIDRMHRRCKIGATIGQKSEWGKGFAREALIPVIGYGFEELGLNRIAAEIYCFNERSRKLFEGLGFQHEGTLRQVVWKQGRAMDDCLYSLLREEWERRGAAR